MYTVSALVQFQLLELKVWDGSVMTEMGLDVDDVVMESQYVSPILIRAQGPVTLTTLSMMNVNAPQGLSRHM